MTDLKPNAELAYRVLDQIDQHPESWNQGEWYRKEACGTVACFAGWAVEFNNYDIALSEEQPALSGRPAHRYGRFVHGIAGRRTFRDVAAEVLGITDLDADDLFDATNTREELGELVLEFFGPRPVTDAHRDDACRAIAAELDRHPDAL